MQTVHEYIRLLIGVVATVFLGAWLAEQYRAQSAQYDTAAQVFHDHSQLLGERISAMAEVVHAEKDNSGEDTLSIQMSAYRAFLGGYNAKRNYNRALIEIYYGDRIYNEERDLHYQLRYVGQALECAYKTHKPADLSAISDALNQSWERLSGLSKHMGVALRDNKIGRNRPQEIVEASKERPNFECEGPEKGAGAG